MKRLILSAILLITLFVAAPVTAQSGGATSIASGNWGAASTWAGGIIPSANMTVTIAAGHVVALDGAATIAGMTIQNGGELRFAPTASATLSSTKNAIVYGKLTMRPATPTILHTLRFININESQVKGGGMVPLTTDVGLWVMCTQDAVMGPNDPFPNLFACVHDSPGGTLDIAGSPKTAWTRAAGSIAQGATQITLEDAPVGWQVGDEISIAPTESPFSVGTLSWRGFDLRTITGISGAVVTLSAPTTRAHPAAINPFSGEVYSAEVLNLTRNTRIEGTGNGNAPLAGNGRSHIFIRSTQPQTIQYVGIRHMGPRKPDGSYTKTVIGRYGLHFHHSMDGSRSTLVEGVVVRDTGSHAFVPHASYGIAFKDTIAYNVFEDAYWWDSPMCTNCAQEHINDSHDIAIDHAVAALVRNDPDFRGTRLSGFTLPKGLALTNSLRNSVAVGVQGNKDANGFRWPESAHGLWIFEDNIAHNNKIDGIFAWQNNGLAHTIDGFVAYNNGEAGIDHGAYRNAYQYIDIDAFGNRHADVRSRASSGGVLRGDGYAHAWERLRLSGIFEIAEHNLPYSKPTLVIDCIIGRIVVDERAKETPGQYDFVNCVKPDGTAIEPSDFTFTFARPDSRFRVQNQGTAWQLAGDGTVTIIEPFYLYLSPLAQQVKDILDANPHVLQELIDAGILSREE